MAATNLPGGYPNNIATAGQAITFEGFKSIEDKEFYERALLEPARQESVLGQFFEQKTFTRNNGSTITWRKPARIVAPEDTRLIEGQVKAPNSFGMLEYTATIQEHGDHVLYSSKLDDLAIDKLIPVVTNEFGWSFKDWLEKRRLRILSTTKNYWFPGVNGTNLSTLDDYRKALAESSIYGINLPDLNTIRAFFKRNNVNDGLTVVVPPEVTSLLFSLKKTADGENYSFVEINNALNRALIFKGQVGEYFGFNFVESNAIESYTYEYDTSKSAIFADCYVLGKVKNSWGASEIKLEGKGFPEMIHKTPGSAGALDPYNMLGSIAWKTYYGGTLIYEEAVIKLTVKLESETFKMFDDANRNNVIKEAHFDAVAQNTTFADLDATNVTTVHGTTTASATKSNSKKVSYPADDGSGYTPVAND